MREQAFISYVREDAATVDELQRVLEDAGIPVWRDTNIEPGEDWWDVIQRAITTEAVVFVACFSEVSVTRGRTVQRRELLLAAEEYRLRPPDRPWIIPVRLSDCEVPSFDLGGGRSLASLHWVDLFGGRWEEGCARLVAAIRDLLPSEGAADRQPRSKSKSKSGSPAAPEQAEPDHARQRPPEPGDGQVRPQGRRIGRRALVVATAAATAGVGAGVWRRLTNDEDGDDEERAGRPIRELTGHRDKVVSVAFSPDGNLLASGSADTTANLWQVGGGRRIASLGSHEGWVRSVAFSDGDDLLATGSADRIVGLWSPRTHHQVAALEGHRGEVWSVAFSPGGRLLASGGQDNTVRLWDPTTHAPITVLNGHRERVISVAFSREGRLLASGSADGTVRLWDPESHQAVAILRGHAAWVVSVAFSPVADVLATASQDNTVKLWDLASNDEIATITHPDPLESLAFSSDGRRLATASARTVRLWDPDTRRRIMMFTAHREKVRSVAFSPTRALLATASEDRTARLWPETNP